MRKNNGHLIAVIFIIIIAVVTSFILSRTTITGRVSYGIPEEPVQEIQEGGISYNIPEEPGSYESAAVNCGDSISVNTNLTENLTCNGSALNLDENNIYLDCKGYTIRGNTSSSGVRVMSNYNVTIKNCIIVNFTRGIYYKNSNGTAVNNTVYLNSKGIYLYNSSDSFVDNNVLYNNTQYGIHLLLSNDVDIINNSLDGDYVQIEHSNSTYAFNNNISASVYGFYATYSNDFLAENNTLNNISTTGIWCGHSLNCSVFNNTVDNSLSGSAVSLISQNRSRVIDNQLSNLKHGIIVNTGFYNNITDNNVVNASDSDGAGIGLYYSDFNRITGNILSGYGKYGMNVLDAHNNTISNNSMDSNANYGIYVDASRNNTFYRNNVTGNHEYGVVLFNSSYNTLQEMLSVGNNRTGIFIKTTSGNKIINNTASNNSASGFYLAWSNNTNMSFNTAEHNYFAGINSFMVESSVFESNSLNYNFIGLTLRNSTNNTLIDTSAEGNSGYGINLFACVDTTVSGATKLFDNNADGMIMLRTNNTAVSGVNASSNNATGVNINLFSYHNNITDSIIIDNKLSGVLIEFFSSFNLVNNSNITSNDRYGVELDFHAVNNTVSYNNLSSNILGNYTETDYSVNNTFVGNTG